jgi:hypothetical protein
MKFRFASIAFAKLQRSHAPRNALYLLSERQVVGLNQKNNNMKKYQTFNKLDDNQTIQEEFDKLKIFQFLLRSSRRLNDHYRGRGQEIADGLQPWIDTLEIILKK